MSEPEFAPSVTFHELAARVTNARGGLSPNDERVAGYLREHLADLPFQTADSLASACGVSRAAVVRFATKLGFDGFADLRSVARQELQRRGESPLTRFGATEAVSLLQKKVARDLQNLQLTEVLVGEAIGPAAAAVADAENVFVFGSRRSAALALYLHRLLHAMRRRVQLVDPGWPDPAAWASPRDAFVVCLFSRYSRLTIELMRSVKASGARIVLVTDGRGHEFASDVPFVLVAATDSPLLYHSMVAPLAVIESLAAEVGARLPAETQHSLEVAEEFSDRHRLLLE